MKNYKKERRNISNKNKYFHSRFNILVVVVVVFNYMIRFVATIVVVCLCMSSERTNSEMIDVSSGKSSHSSLFIYLKKRREKNVDE